MSPKLKEPSVFKTASVKELVSRLELQPHIEGGFFRETDRDPEKINTNRGLRNVETTIHYCLPSNDFSVFHLLVDLEETFYFHYGDPTIIYTVKDGIIVSDILADEPIGKPEIVIPPNTWFAIRPSGIRQPSEYSLMSCRVIPGFDYQDLMIADESLLDLLDVSQHKLARSLIRTETPNRKSAEQE